MAIEACAECGKDVSTTAESCPHCGAVPSGKKAVATATSGARIILMVLGILLAVPAVMIGGCFGLIVPGILILLALCLK